jgi:hypothetical protein
MPLLGPPALGDRTAITAINELCDRLVDEIANTKDEFGDVVWGNGSLCLKARLAETLRRRSAHD